VGADGFADNLLRAAMAVNGRGVDEVDAAFDGAEAGGDGYVIGDSAPVQAANGPCAQTDARYANAGDGRCLHGEHLKCIQCLSGSRKIAIHISFHNTANVSTAM
jgi:hypothetical protein